MNTHMRNGLRFRLCTSEYNRKKKIFLPTDAAEEECT